MYPQKPSPHSEHRQREMERTEQSVTLAQKFPGLTSLVASLSHFRPDGELVTRAVKYTFNLDQAKSLFRFDCSNPECVGGDFDLSGDLAQAVAARQKIASGESVCQGWRSKDAIGSARCQNILRFKLNLGYKPVAAKPRAKSVESVAR
jgi:hypothetical protein